MEIPTLETARLRLRPYRLDDFAALAERWAHPEVVRHIGGAPSSPEESWTRLLKQVGHWQLLGFGYWAVEEKASGLCVGDVGFAEHKRAMTPSIDGLPELGWVLAPAAHGKGFATEAARAALAWLDADGRFARSVCIIKPENAASIRVAEKLGFREWCRTAYKDKPTLLFSREKERPGSQASA
jgi:RimJ/RimL family protein N-acetyltransferase